MSLNARGQLISLGAAALILLSLCASPVGFDWLGIRPARAKAALSAKNAIGVKAERDNRFHPTTGKLIRSMPIPGTALQMLECEVELGDLERAFGGKNLGVFAAASRHFSKGETIRFRWYYVSAEASMNNNLIRIADQ